MTQGCSGSSSLEVMKMSAPLLGAANPYAQDNALSSGSFKDWRRKNKLLRPLMGGGEVKPGDCECCRCKLWSWVPRPLSRNCQIKEFLLREGVVSETLNKHLQSEGLKT